MFCVVEIEEAFSLALENALHTTFFKKYTISSLYTEKWKDSKEIVAQKQKYTSQLLFNKLCLDIPLLDFNPEDQFNKIAEESKVFSTSEPTPRDISLCCTVRGKGGGKTRALQEVCFEALKSSNNCLAIGVTFNSHTSISYEDFDGVAWKILMVEKKYPSITQYTDLLIFSACSRILASFYSIPYDIVISRLQNILLSLPEWSGKVVFVTVVNHVLCHTRRSRPVDKFLLVIDESKMAVEELKNVDKTIYDPYVTLRDSLLSGDFFTKMAHPMLLMSGLTVLPTMIATDSKRQIVAIPLAEHLDNSQVTELLLEKLRSNNIHISKTTEKQLQLWAALFSNVPRTMEYALAAIDKVAAKKHRNLANSIANSTAAVAFDAAFATAWLSEIKGLCAQYSSMKIATFDSSLLRALVLSEEVSVLEESVRTLIQMSEFTNSLHEMPDDNAGSTSAMIKPITSPLLLWRRLESNMGGNSPMLQQMYSTVVSTMNYIKERQTMPSIGSVRQNAGSLLENMMTGMIKLRFLAFSGPPHGASKAFRKTYQPTVSLHTMLALPNSMEGTILKDVVVDLRELHLQLKTQKSNDSSIKGLPQSFLKKVSFEDNGNLTEIFLKDLGTVVVSKVSPVRLIKFNMAERADGGMLLYRGKEQPPLLVLWDCESRAPLSSRDLSDFDWAQAQYWCSRLPSHELTCNTASDLSASKRSCGQSGLDALAKGQVLFIYLDDWKSPVVHTMTWKDGQRLVVSNEEQDNFPLAIRLNDGIMTKLMVFWSPLYTAARDLYDTGKTEQG